MPTSSINRLILSTFIVLGLVGAYWSYRWVTNRAARPTRLWAWLRDPNQFPEWTIQSGVRCGQAPFLTPTDGFVGFLWNDSFRPGHRHQGVDIFSGTKPGVTPVYAAHAGYLTRLPAWKSSVIIRIPQDPLQPNRQIWTYYTHLADRNGASFIVPNFPPGTHEVFVETGTLLGYQGDYSGNPTNPVGVHLHFSIVLDDGQGNFRNELDIENTLDPSPYLGLPLNAQTSQGEFPTCLPAGASATEQDQIKASPGV